MRPNDPTFTKTQTVSDWLSFGDQLDFFNLLSGYGYAVGAYRSSVHGAVHMLMSTEDRVKMEWPSKDREAYFRQQQRENIVQCVADSLAGTLHGFTKTIFARDMVAALADILSPKIPVGRNGVITGLFAKVRRTFPTIIILVDFLTSIFLPDFQGDGRAMSGGDNHEEVRADIFKRGK